MNNHERWRLYNSEATSPDSYIDAAWCFMISAALQRRVWIESARVIWPNQYTIFVAPPGVGKGITSVVKSFLAHYKYDGTPNILADRADDGTRSEKGPRLLFPLSATATTYPKFINSLANSLAFVKNVRPSYVHCSTAFVLEELASIFKKQADDMLTFLLEGWTCEGEYSNETIGRGTDYAPNVCVNIIGGTQPDKFADMLRMGVISSGLARRLMVLYEPRSRKSHFLMPEHTVEEQLARVEILKHLLLLSRLYGPVKITAEAVEYMNELFEDRDRWRINDSPYLDSYYESRQLHVHKLAMALHFGESTRMEIGLDAYKYAHEMLVGFEKTMHLAYSPRAATDVTDVKDDVLRLMDNVGAPMGITQMYTPFVRKVGMSEFLTALGDLQSAGRIRAEGEKFSLVSINGVHARRNGIRLAKPI